MGRDAKRLLLFDDCELVGIASATELLQAIATTTDLETTTVATLVSSPVIAASEDCSPHQASDLMTQSAASCTVITRSPCKSATVPWLRDEGGNPREIVGIVVPATLLRWCQQGIDFDRASVGSLLQRDRQHSSQSSIVREPGEFQLHDRQLVEHFPDIIYLLSPQRGIIYYSPSVETILGYSPEDLYQNPQIWIDAIHPDDLPNVACTLDCPDIESPIASEYRIRDRQGNWHWLYDRTIGAYRDGNETIIEGIATDITTRKQAETALRDSEARFRSIFNNTSVGMALLDLDGCVLLANDADCQFLGYSAAQLDRMHFSQFTHPDEVERDLQLFAELVRGQRDRIHLEKRYLRSDGTAVWGRLSASLVRDGGGSAQYVVVLHEDISEQKQAEAALRESEERWHLALRGNNDGIWDWNVQTNEVFFSSRWKEMLGYDDGEIENVIGEWKQRVHPDDWLRVLQAVNDHLAGKTPFYLTEHRLRCKDGSYKWILDRGQALWNAEGIPVRMVGSHTDITARKQVEENLRKSEELFRLTFELAPIGMAIKTLDGRFQRVNQTLCDCLGYSSGELLQRTWLDITHPDDIAKAQALHQKLFRGEISNFKLENRYIAKRGNAVDGRLQVSVVRDGAGNPLHLIGQFLDLSDRKQAEEQLRHDALHDALTGLPNRTLLMECIELSLQRTKRYSNYSFALLFIDVDRFKLVNDSLGHWVGDRLLVEVANKLRSMVRSTDLVSRLGGDEFVILLDGIQDLNHPIRVANRIAQKLSAPFYLGDREVFTTASIGIAIASKEYARGLDLLRDADIAMYRAKDQGKARYEIFDRAMYVEVLEQLQLENDLRRAIARQEFLVYYQPIVILETEQITGFEALIRWQHPERGLVSPAHFIPIAEETGLIVPIGEWVLRQACSQMQAWQQKFPQMRSWLMCVNLSGKQFREVDFIDCLDRILTETGLASRCLKLELTESMLMEDIDEIVSLLDRIQSRGIQLSIDDFGTGYSSLSYLHRFPIDTLKIDRSFVSRIGTDGESLGIVEAIVTLAKQLGMNAIAEGIETPSQLKQLRSLSCQWGQGYLFAKPMDARTIEASIAREFSNSA